MWIVRALRDALAFAGRDAGELPALLAADNAAPAVTLAPAARARERDRACRGARRGRAVVADAVRLPAAATPDALAAVREGRAARAGRGQPAGRARARSRAAGRPRTSAWLDLCAGPGGKAALLGAVLAARACRRRRLVANEVAEHRAELVRRLGRRRRRGHRISSRCAPATGATLGEDEPARYDRVLVDAPCTGLGALRRRPEARWRRAPGTWPPSVPCSASCCGRRCAAVRPGGVVAYVTCSPHPAETRLVVDDVLRRASKDGVDGVERLDARATMPGVPELGSGPDVQLWPHVHGTDAMYLALLRTITAVIMHFRPIMRTVIGRNDA